jgi:UDP-N-acetylglucosamine 2-epimerase
MKLVSIVGARPQFIKCSVVSRELRKNHDELLVHTGQHYDREMSAQFFEELEIPEPDYNLGVGSGSHAYQTGEMLKRTEQVLIDEDPKIVLVYGDTNSTLAGSLAAVKMDIPVAHVEAGLRSFDRRMPEEINRVLTDHCANILFAPTKTAVKNLNDEGIKTGVFLTGDVMVDALYRNLEIARRKSNVIERLQLEPKGYYLVTLHRQENVDQPEQLSRIIDALCSLPGMVVFPCHPRTEKMLKTFHLWEKASLNLNIIKPVGYLDMLLLEKHANKILTDSGGVQKEAYILEVPCITLRNSTEWVETVEDGWNVLVGSDRELVIQYALEFSPLKSQRKHFGEGDAAGKIVGILEGYGQ